MLHNRQNLLQQCRQPDDRTALAKVLDQAAFCAKNHEACFTEFMDPRQAALFMGILSGIEADGLHVQAFGGHPGAERQMLGFWQDYMTPEEADFPITPLRLRYDAKFAEGLTHRDFLGSTLGTGITRALVGDIAVMPSQTILFVHSDIADYLSGALDKVKRLRVEAEVCPAEELFVFQTDRSRVRLTVASLRLDAVASALFRLSRAQIADLIRGDKVLLNWTAAKATASVAAGDVITIRSTGRVKVVEIEGETKKARVALICELY